MPPHKGIKLRFAITLLVILTLFSTIIISWYSATIAIKNSLSNNYLENNYKYADKLSESTGDLLHHMQLSINGMANILGHKEITQEHLDERRASLKDYFNSLFILDSQGVIQYISPSVVEFDYKVQAGTKIESETIKHALALKQPFISKPYIATSGQLIMLISAPIFDRTGTYKGLIAGTIYLESSENALNLLLKENENPDGSYVYVVDSTGHLIYHPDPSRINEDLTNNQAVKKVLNRQNGSAQIMNTEGKEFFSGYAYEKYTGWGIVSQTPVTVMEEPLHNLLKNMMIQSFPLLLIILLVAGIFTNTLLKPLNQLATFSEEAINQKKATIPINRLKIKSHIYEVHQLYYQLYNYFQLLNNQIQLDGLTGLANRRTFDIEIKDLLALKMPFTMIMIDIDFFKKVNDTYGHLIGDDVLKYLSRLIEQHTSEDNLCFRYGGEEFGILLKNTNKEDAFLIAEQLRKVVDETISPTGEHITISIGIASSRENDQHPEQIIKRADAALFQSKMDGRNRTTCYTETCDAVLA